MGIEQILNGCKQLVENGLVEQSKNVWGRLVLREEMQLLFTKLATIDLSHVLFTDQLAMYQDLIPLVSGFATTTADIGLVKGFDFQVELKFQRGFSAAPIKYTPA